MSMIAHLALVSLLATATADRATAPELFEDSRTAYRDGRFAEAAELLRRAYQLDPDPVLLYNLARALENDGDIVQARIAYEQYVRNKPDAKDRKAIEARIAKLWERQKKDEAVEAERRRLEAEQQVLENQQTADVAVAPWVIAGIGATAMATGAMVGVLAQNRDGDARSAANQRDAIALRDEAEGLASLANAALACGAVVAVGGLVWGIVDVSSQPDIGLAVTPQSVSVVGRF